MISAGGQIVANRRLAGDLWQLILSVDKIPAIIQAGQYVHVALGAAGGEHLLRRPFSVQAVLGSGSGPGSVSGAQPSQIVITYQVVGSGTALLTSCLVGDTLGVLGPLGQGWRLPSGGAGTGAVRRALLVGGGVGWAPLAMAAEQLLSRGIETHSLVGARSRDYLEALGVASLAEAGGLVAHYSTDDGSFGHHGFNVDLLDDLLDSAEFGYIAACGPEPMQAKVALAAAERGIACEVSLERRMACGLGVCLSCTVQTRSGNRKACVDGPVFDAQEVIW